jgi:Flp pilus assembly protein TadG
MVEFSMTIGLLMFVIVATTQIAIYLHYRNSLALVAREGAFDAGLAGHTTADGEQTARQMWARLEPGGGTLAVQAHLSGGLVLVSASATAPAIIPVPIPPFARLPVTARAVHTVEVFRPGSG